MSDFKFSEHFINYECASKNEKLDETLNEFIHVLMNITNIDRNKVLQVIQIPQFELDKMLIQFRDLLTLSREVNWIINQIDYYSLENESDMEEDLIKVEQFTYGKIKEFSSQLNSLIQKLINENPEIIITAKDFLNEDKKNTIENIKTFYKASLSCKKLNKLKITQEVNELQFNNLLNKYLSLSPKNRREHLKNLIKKRGETDSALEHSLKEIENYYLKINGEIPIDISFEFRNATNRLAELKRYYSECLPSRTNIGRDSVLAKVGDYITIEYIDKSGLKNRKKLSEEIKWLKNKMENSKKTPSIKSQDTLDTQDKNPASYKETSFFNKAIINIKKLGSMLLNILSIILQKYVDYNNSK